MFFKQYELCVPLPNLAPLEAPPDETAEAPPPEDKPEEEEPPPRPPSPVTGEPEPEPETERKTPRMASLRAKMKDRLQKAKVNKNAITNFFLIL